MRQCIVQRENFHSSGLYKVIHDHLGSWSILQRFGFLWKTQFKRKVSDILSQFYLELLISPFILLNAERKAHSTYQRCSLRKGVLRNFTKFISKYLCRSLFFNKVADLTLQLYKKGDSSTGVFLWVAKFLRTPFLQNTSGWLFLKADEIGSELGLDSSLLVI